LRILLVDIFWPIPLDALIANSILILASKALAFGDIFDSLNIKRGWACSKVCFAELSIQNMTMLLILKRLSIKMWLDMCSSDISIVSIRALLTSHRRSSRKWFHIWEWSSICHMSKSKDFDWLAAGSGYPARNTFEIAFWTVAITFTLYFVLFSLIIESFSISSDAASKDRIVSLSCRLQWIGLKTGILKLKPSFENTFEAALCGIPIMEANMTSNICSLESKLAEEWSALQISCTKLSGFPEYTSLITDSSNEIDRRSSFQ
jgi:hypothetical protein